MDRTPVKMAVNELEATTDRRQGASALSELVGRPGATAVDLMANSAFVEGPSDPSLGRLRIVA